MKTALVITIVTCLCAGTGLADSTSISGTAVTDDAMLNQWGSPSGGRSYGATTLLTMKVDSSNRVLLRFDLSAINGTVTACTLFVFWNWSDAATNLSFYRVSSSWVEGDMDNAEPSTGHHGVTWNNRDDFASGDGADVAWTTAGGDRVFRFTVSIGSGGGRQVAICHDSLKADVQYCVGNGAGNYGWMLQTPSGYNGASVNSSEASSNPPRLWVQYIPSGAATVVHRSIHGPSGAVHVQAASGADKIQRP